MKQIKTSAFIFFIISFSLLVSCNQSESTSEKNDKELMPTAVNY